MNLLDKQKNLIYKGYEDILDKYGNKIFNEGTSEAFSISECIAEVRNFFYENPLSSLTAEIENKGYVKNPTFSLEKINLEIESLLIKKEDNERKINELTNLFHTLYGYDVEVVTLGQEASEEFLNRLNMFYNRINELTDTYTFVARNTNKAGVYVTYNTPAYVFENGGLTLFIELLISTLAGVVFGILAVFFKKEG